MTTQAQHTRDRIIDVAMQLFGEKGYNSTSVADILRDARANSGSLYHFFPTKQDVLIAVLERYRDGIGPMLLEPAWAHEPDPVERIFALLDRYRQLIGITDFRYGCPIGNLALELAEPDPHVRALIAANFTGWIEAVEAQLQLAADRFPDDVDPHRLAVFVLTTMEGAVMQARTYQSFAPFDASVDCLRDYFRLLEARVTV